MKTVLLTLITSTLLVLGAWLTFFSVDHYTIAKMNSK